MSMSPAAKHFRDEIGNVKDDLTCARSLSGDVDKKTGSFLQRTYRGLLVRTHSLTAAYLREVVHEVLKFQPLHELLPSAEISFTVEQVMTATSLTDLQLEASGEVYRKMESRFKNRSGSDLVGQIVRALNSKKIEPWKLLQPQVEPFFALRHLIVHNKSRFDQTFVEDFGSISRAAWGTPTRDADIPGKAALVRASINAFKTIVEFVDPIFLSRKPPTLT